jgi:hypothetical protein
MKILHHFRLLAVLFLLLWSGAAPAQTGEVVAVLYAHDGDTLFRIDPDSGELITIGALDHYFAQGRWLTSYGSMTYDAKQHKLYAYATYLANAETTMQMIVEIDPETAALRDVIDSVLLGPPVNLSYDWRRGQLCQTTSDTPAWTPIYAVNPDNGSETLVNRGRNVGGFPIQLGFFDNRGCFWLWVVSDEDRYLIKYDVSVPDGKQIYRIEGRVQAPGGPPRPGEWPRYRSFSFDPYTGALFATFAPLYVDADGQYEVTLCTFNLQTGQPSRIIATYKKSDFWNLQITWGLSR